MLVQIEAAQSPTFSSCNIHSVPPCTTLTHHSIFANDTQTAGTTKGQGNTGSNLERPQFRDDPSQPVSIRVANRNVPSKPMSRLSHPDQKAPQSLIDRSTAGSRRLPSFSFPSPYAYIYTRRHAAKSKRETNKEILRFAAAWKQVAHWSRSGCASFVSLARLYLLYNAFVPCPLHSVSALFFANGANLVRKKRNSCRGVAILEDLV